MNIPIRRAWAPNTPLLSMIEMGIDRTNPASTGLSHQKNAGNKMKDDTPQTRPKNVCPPCVMIASRQSVPSSTPRRCVTHDTPCPSRLNSTNLLLNIMCTGASSAEIIISSSAEITNGPRPPKRAAPPVSCITVSTLITFGRNNSSMVKRNSANASGTSTIVPNMRVYASRVTSPATGESTWLNTWIVLSTRNSSQSGHDTYAMTPISR